MNTKKENSTSLSPKYYCNPINVDYRYQFNKTSDGLGVTLNREAADPSLIMFNGRYYLFASMQLCVWSSDDLVTWESHRLPDNLPLYDYAPDVRVIGEYVYYCASRFGDNCDYYRTKNIEEGPYEKIDGTFAFWDPNLFVDDDGRIYFYWGCTNTDPIWGAELDPDTLLPLHEKKALIFGDALVKGYERIGDDHSIMPRTDEEIEKLYLKYIKENDIPDTDVTRKRLLSVTNMFSNRPYIEGAWMTKHNGKYYLQYACPGAEFNVYADGVYVSDSPLGPFEPSDNNPFSYNPGGFMTGAGHGSTLEDSYGNFWHTSTMRISITHTFERRVGLWPAGFDKDGELFCNQRYADWPREVSSENPDPWAPPCWYLLSYNKNVTASSTKGNNPPSNAVDENSRTWWQASSSKQGEWICIDLQGSHTVHAVQINFSDDKLSAPVPGDFDKSGRYIEERSLRTRWILEGSTDGTSWVILKDKSDAETDLPHDFIVFNEGLNIRFIKLTIVEVPYDQNPCISGLRVFGIGNGQAPAASSFNVKRISDLDMIVTINEDDATGHTILWGTSPDKLYHSCITYGNEQKIGALIKNKSYYVRVDSFNENGITEGSAIKLI